MDTFPGPFENWQRNKRYRLLSKNYRKLVDGYYDYSLGRQTAVLTIHAHWYFILRFLEFLETIKILEISKVNIEIINTFLASAHYKATNREQPISNSYAHGFSISLKSFFDFLHETGVILINPGSKIRLPKIEKTLPRGVLTKAEAMRLLNSQPTVSFIGLRDRVILELLYGCGLRGREVRLLKMDDIDLKSGLMIVKEGKGKKDRYVPLGKAVIHWLNKYLSARQAIAANSPYLFLVDYGRVPLGKCRFWRIIKEAAKKAKITKSIVPHTLRHSYATHLLEAGAPLNAIQALLGHAHLTSTQIYTHVDISQLKSLHRRCHPRERVKEV